MMSDREDNPDDQDDTDEEGTGMRAAYSIDDLMAELGGDDEFDDHDPEGANDDDDVTAAGNSRKQDATTDDRSASSEDDSAEEEKQVEDTSTDTRPFSLTADKKQKLNEKNELEKRQHKDSLSSESTEKGQNLKDDDAISESDEHLYQSSEEVRERKNQSSSGSASNETELKLASVVSGDNSDYVNVGENIKHDTNDDTFYDDIALEEENKKGGTLVPGHKSSIEDSVDKDIYENIDHSAPLENGKNIHSSNTEDDTGWGSSEFEEYDESGGEHSRQQSTENINQSKVKDNAGMISAKTDKKSRLDRLTWRKSRTSLALESPSSASNSPGNMFEKVAARLGQKMRRDGDDESAADESGVLDVPMNFSKHPPPEFPPAPNGLTPLQLKRRHIVCTIIESEKSYSSSLQRLVEDYEKPLLEAKPQILSKDAIKTIFYKIHDILRCHYMFQIELEQVVRVWDDEEKIGNVFTASFSKSIVFEAYSLFVVNYSVAMETAKKQARAKAAFAEFLKLKIEASEDRLSLFGLMVKPVQRFPQFIMLLQDLLKFTPQNHHDRLSLQLALTELDTLTDRLNEAKRESESKLEVKRLLANLTGIISFKIDSNCFLVRQDDIIEIKQKNGEVQEKPRRLFLLNDQLICTDVSKRGDFTNGEKFAFQWSVPIKEVEYIPSNYAINVIPGRSLMSPASMARFIELGENNPYKKEVEDMIHDLRILDSMMPHFKELRIRHSGFDSETLTNLIRNLHIGIGRKCNIEHCLMTLSFPTKVLHVSTEKQFKGQVAKQISKVGRTKSVVDAEVRANSRVQFTFLFPAVAMKLDWLQELQNSKLATGKHDPSWYTVESDQPTYKNPYFYHPLLLDVTKEEAKKLLKSRKKTKEMVQCATCVTLPSSDDPDLRVQHLWVCNGDETKGQVSIVSFHTNEPCVIETFKVCDSLICCSESVPTIGSAGSSSSVTEETVWMGTQDKKIIICKVNEIDRLNKRVTINTDSIVSSLKYMNNKMFVGMKNGAVLIYIFSGGVWDFKEPIRQSLGGLGISCLLPIGQDMWVSTGQMIHVLTLSTTLKANDIRKVSHELPSDYGPIECMVKAGVGLMVAFCNRAIIRLYHLETLQHLQDINIASAITPLLEGKPLVSPFSEDRKLFSLNITCLLSGYGLLWVGTNYGFILTLPLPRLEGVPQVNRRPAVSYHAHSGPIKFLAAVNCGSSKLTKNSAKHTISSGTKMLEITESKASAGNADLVPKRQGNLAVAEAEKGLGADLLQTWCEDGTREHDGTLHPILKNQWISNPELRSCKDIDDDGDVSSLYGSLLKGIDADIDSELIDLRHRPKGGNLQQNINAVSNRMSKLSNAVRRNMPVVLSSQSERTSGKCHSAVPYTDDCASPVDSEKDQSLVIPESSSHNELLNRSAEDDLANCQAVKTMGDHGSEHPNNENDMVSKKPIDVQSSFNSSMLANASVCRGITSKRLVVVSGGEGHINWKETKPFDKSYEDICLLLWKC